MTHGGAREGAGRPKGSTSKPRFSDYLSPEKAQALADKAIEMANAGDTQMLKFVLEQYLGKAPQSMDITSGDQPIPLLNALRNNDSNKEAEPAPQAP